MNLSFLKLEDHSEVSQQLLASSLVDNQLIAGLHSLEGFWEEPYRTVASAVLHLCKKNGFVTLGTLLAHLEKSRAPKTVLEAARALENIPLNPKQAEVYLQISREKQQALALNRLKQQLNDSVASANDAFEIEQRVDNVLKNVKQQSTDLVQSGIVDLVEYARHLSSRSNGKDFQGYDSGFRYFNLVYNGVSPGLHILAAIPGCGKSTFAWQLANQVASHAVPVVYVHFEQSKTDLLDKAMSRLAGINSRDLARGKIALDGHANGQKIASSMKTYAEKIAPWVVVHEADENTDVAQIERIFTDSLKMLGKTGGLLIVDYLQMVPVKEDVVGLFSTMDRVSHNLGALRRIARDLDSPVLAISSMNRASYKSKSMAGFKESGNVEYSADTAAILYAESGFDDRTRSKSMSLNVVKNRNGETARINYRFQPEFSIFVEEGRACLDSEEVE